jgi:glutamate dehydrogenase (NAD(P)+)
MTTATRLELIEISGVSTHQVSCGSDLLGFVAIDSLVAGRSSGGLRLLPDVDAEEMAGLAKAMTLKYGFLGLPQGGAKAGVRGDPEAPSEERLRRLAAFGEAIRPLLRSQAYVPHADMGTCSADIAHMLRTQGIAVWPRTVQNHDSGYYTAVSVALAAEEAFPLVGIRPGSFSAAIEGFGKVGQALAKILVGLGARIAAVSTSRGAIYNPEGLDVNRLTQMSGEWGSQVIEHYQEADRIAADQLLELPVDLLSPCARHDSIHAGNAKAVGCRLICAGANNPVTAQAGDLLFNRGVLYVPDFVSNCGGVLGGTMEFAGLRHEKIVALMRQFLGPAVRDVLLKAQAAGTAPMGVAERIARERFREVKRQAESPGLAGKLLQAGLWAYRRGLVPSSLVCRLSPAYFSRLPVTKIQG